MNQNPILKIFRPFKFSLFISLLLTLSLFPGLELRAQSSPSDKFSTPSAQMPTDNQADGYSVSPSLNSPVLKPQIANIGKILAVPYFNQRLSPSGQNEYPKSGNWMCSAASSVMVAAYFDKLGYDKNNTWSLKKYMYTDSGQGITPVCPDNSDLVKQFSEPGIGGAFYQTSLGICNGGNTKGIRNYFTARGLTSDYINFDFASIKYSIDQNRPVFMSITSPLSHIFVITGYTTDGKVIANDPWTNLQTSSNILNPSNTGRNAVYDLSKLARSYALSVGTYDSNWIPNRTFEEANSGASDVQDGLYDGTNWASFVDTGADTNITPAAVEFNGKLWLLVRVNSTFYLKFSGDGINWSGLISTGRSSETGGSLAVFNNRLYLAHLGVGENRTKMYLSSSSDGINFNPWQQTTLSSSATPKLVSFGSKLFVIFKGAGDNNINTSSSTNGLEWTTPTQITGAMSYLPVTTAVFQNRLYVGIKSVDDAALYTSSDTGTSWSAWQNTGRSSTQVPSLTAFNNQLYMVHKGSGDSKIYMSSSIDGLNWGNWTESTSGAISALSPVIGTFGSKLFLIHRGNVNSLAQPVQILPAWSNWTRKDGATVLDLDQIEYGGLIYQAVRGTDNRLYTRYFDASLQNPSPWLEGGGITLASAPNFAIFGDKLYISATGSDSRLYTRYFDSTSKSWTKWVEGGGITTTQTVKALEVSGTLYQFAVGTNSSLYARTFISNSWTSWQKQTSISLNTVPSLNLYNGKIYASARGSDSQLYAASFDTSAKTWTPWQNGAGISLATGPQSLIFAGKLFQTAQGTDGHLYDRYYDLTGNFWTFWIEGDGITLNSAPSIAVLGSTVYEFAAGSDNKIYYRDYTKYSNSWNTWKQVETISSKGSPKTLTLPSLNKIWLSAIGSDSGIYNKTSSDYNFSFQPGK